MLSLAEVIFVECYALSIRISTVSVVIRAWFKYGPKVFVSLPCLPVDIFYVASPQGGYLVRLENFGGL